MCHSTAPQRSLLTPRSRNKEVWRIMNQNNFWFKRGSGKDQISPGDSRCTRCLSWDQFNRWIAGREPAKTPDPRARKVLVCKFASLVSCPDWCWQLTFLQTTDTFPVVRVKRTILAFLQFMVPLQVYDLTFIYRDGGGVTGEEAAEPVKAVWDCIFQHLEAWHHWTLLIQPAVMFVGPWDICMVSLRRSKRVF